MPGHKRSTSSKDEVIAIPTKKKRRSAKNAESSSLSVLDEELTRQLATVAEIAIKNYLEQQRNIKPKKPENDDEIQVISEITNKIKQPQQTVLQLGLPKDLQGKIIDQLKASGKSAGQIELNNLFSEVFSKTVRKMNGLEITTASIRISSNGNKKEETENKEEVPKKCKKTLNNNKSSLKSDNKAAKIALIKNGHHNHTKSSPKSRSVENGVQNGGLHVTPEAGKRGRPRKEMRQMTLMKPKIVKTPPLRSSKRLHDHAMKDWPYQAQRPLKEEVESTFNKEKAVTAKKKKKLKGPHRESSQVKLLRKLSLFHKNGQAFASVGLFNQLFVKFRLNTGSLISLMVSLHGDPGKDLHFKKWQVTHLSLRATQEVLRVMKKPLFLDKVLDQLQTLPRVSLQRVSPETYNKTHLTQLSRNEFCNLFALDPASGPTRVSMRTKQPTQKFQDSPCITSMTTLSTSITTPPKKPPISPSTASTSSLTGASNKPTNSIEVDKQLKEKALRNLDKSWISGRLRPKFRQLLDRKGQMAKKTSSVSEAANTTTDCNFLADVAADENEIIVLEDDSPELIDVTEMSSRMEDICTNVTEIGQPEAAPETTANVIKRPSPRSNLAVRKFPSYGWNREKEARIKVEIAKSKEPSPPVIQVSKKAKNLDFPPFQLSGLVETAPKEVEGWFTSKVSLLRQLSESNQSGSSKSSSPCSSRSGSVQKKSTSTTSNGKIPAVKVFLDQDVETISDLAEYKQHLEHINSIIEEIETSTAIAEANNEAENNEHILNEALRVARKIEKISIAGIGRSVSLPNPHSFLPPGWHCRQAGRGWEYVNSDGYKVKSVQAAIKYETGKKDNNGPSSSSSELFDSKKD